jgi:hypothetical protein
MISLHGGTAGVATYKWKVYNWKIEILSFVVKLRNLYLSEMEYQRGRISTSEWMTDCCLAPCELLVHVILIPSHQILAITP